MDVAHVIIYGHYTWELSRCYYYKVAYVIEFLVTRVKK